MKDEVSPYLIQHKNNPVDWYPWGEEAFARAKEEDKPVFLSIGYSTCHWCHVMAHESFEDEKVAGVLNRYFVSIKVDKEERPDIDSIYMSVCQAYTGNGGWPTSIFMTPDQKPFFAGTYFPKTTRYGQVGFVELLLAIRDRWEHDREDLLDSAEELIAQLNRQTKVQGSADAKLTDVAVELYKRTFDDRFGGFGRAPKFPTPHNLLFLMQYYEKFGDESALHMAEITLLQMYRGGLFDHIGGGFSRYSTDAYFLVPHFEKMLYDNALLILAYCKAYQVTQSPIYRQVAEKTAAYVLGEMTSPEGGFYSAQDADSEGVEGKYYLLKPAEIIKVLGEQRGEAFNHHYDITEQGNSQGKNIPNLLKNSDVDTTFEDCLPAVYEYRRKRYSLHLDDKILTSWNALMIAAMCHLYRVTGDDIYRKAAVEAEAFVSRTLCEKDTLYVSYRDGKRSGRGFLDEYAMVIYALLELYEATLKHEYLERGIVLCDKVVKEFYDAKQGGFYFYGEENEQLILRPKETYDGAIFSGNSAMAYNLVRLYYLTGEDKYKELSERQLAFMSGEAAHYPAGYAMFLMALSDYFDPPELITVVVKSREDIEELPCKVTMSSILRLMKPSKEYAMKDDKTTFYVCRGHMCLPPTNDYLLP